MAPKSTSPLEDDLLTKKSSDKVCDVGHGEQKSIGLAGSPTTKGELHASGLIVSQLSYSNTFEKIPRSHTLFTHSTRLGDDSIQKSHTESFRPCIASLYSYYNALSDADDQPFKTLPSIRFKADCSSTELKQESFDGSQKSLELDLMAYELEKLVEEAYAELDSDVEDVDCVGELRDVVGSMTRNKASRIFECESIPEPSAVDADASFQHLSKQ